MGLGIVDKRVCIGKLTGTGVFNPIGDQVGKIRDIAATFQVNDAENIIDFAVEVGPHKKVFLPLTRVASIKAGLVVTTGLPNIRSFMQYPVETLVLAEPFDWAVALSGGSGKVRVLDVVTERRRPKDWVISKLHVQRQRTTALGFTKSGETLNMKVSKVSKLLKVDTSQAVTSLIAQTEDMHPAGLANHLHDLPIECQMVIAQQLPDACLADVLEELGDDNRVMIVSGLEASHAAGVLGVMQPDGAANLVSELPEAQAQTPLPLMEPEEARDARRLLFYAKPAAGSLMTTGPVIFGPDATVVQTLVSARREGLPTSLATVAFVTCPPEETPIGSYLGMAHIQRALRGPPQILLGTILDPDIKAVSPQVHIATVTRLLATYNLTILPIADEDSHLPGAASVNNLLDEPLSEDWRDCDGEATDRIMTKSTNG